MFYDPNEIKPRIPEYTVDPPSESTSQSIILDGRLVMKALIVDDDATVSSGMKRILADEAFQVTRAGSVTEFDQVWAKDAFDIVLVDLHLPDGSGKDIIRAISGFNRTGVIVVSGDSDVYTSAITLELGADDFIKKPFLKADLLARVRSVLRRVANSPVAVGDEDQSVAEPSIASGTQPNLTFASFTLDPNSRMLSDSAGEVIHLTKSEYDLLKYLLENHDKVHPRQELLEAIRRPGWAGEKRLVDGLINRLRSKLGESAKIRTVRGIGYIMSIDEQANI